MLPRMHLLAIAVAVAGLASNDASRFAGAYIPGGAIKTARIGSAVVAVAERASAFDPSWASSLLFSDGPGAPRELIDHVFYASRPLPLPSGEVAVERGIAGAVVPGRVRVDNLLIDVVDPRTGALRRIYVTSGFEAHLAALAGDEIIVYLIQPGGASLSGVDWRTGKARVIVPSIAPFAHDFGVDGNALVVHNRDADHRERETIDRIDLANGNVTRLDTR
jgi:hypothetical protein